MENCMTAAVWLATHPHDLWDDDEDERRGWSHMHVDLHVETVELCHAVTGFYDEPTNTKDMLLRTRARFVGIARARQERFFSSEWIEGNGVWGEKKKKKKEK